MTKQNVLTTVLSYPDRGPYGDPFFRGNCSGLLIKDLLLYYKPRKVLDPMEGSGTCRDVCKELGIKYIGNDLSSGMDMYSSEFREYVNLHKPIDFIFWHPPYSSMIRYSDDSRDLSNLRIPVFQRKLILGAKFLYSLLLPQGHLAVLIGTMRRNGNILRFNVDLINWKDPTEPEIIKVQHNCNSDRTVYSGKFIPIIDERLLIWKKS